MIWEVVVGEGLKLRGYMYLTEGLSGLPYVRRTAESSNLSSSSTLLPDACRNRNPAAKTEEPYLMAFQTTRLAQPTLDISCRYIVQIHRADISCPSDFKLAALFRSLTVSEGMFSFP